MMTGKPELLAGEAPKTFRLRAIYWLLKQSVGGMTSDEVMIRYNEYFQPPKAISKETVVRDLKILQARKQIGSEASDDDGRRWLWSCST